MNQNNLPQTQNQTLYLNWLQSPSTALTRITAVTVKDAIYSKSPSVFKLSLISEQTALSVINLMIVDLVKFLNLGKSMDANQVLQTAKLILTDKDMRNLKPDDFKICFENAKKGRYGKTFDRIDGQIIFEWLNAYLAERMETHENLAQQLHDERKAGKVKPEEVNPEGQKKVLEILKNSLPGSDVKIEKPKTGPSERDKFIQSCLMDHYKLWLKNPAKDLISGEGLKGRFIMHEGRPIDEIEYTEIKLSEAGF